MNDGLDPPGPASPPAPMAPAWRWKMNAGLRCALLMLLDACVVAVAYHLAFRLRFEVLPDEPTRAATFRKYDGLYEATLPWLIALRWLCGGVARTYFWSYALAGLMEGARVVLAVMAGTLLFAGMFRVVGTLPPPRSVLALEALLTLAGVLALRFLPRYLYMLVVRRWRRRAGEPRARTLIFGAGGNGELLLRDLLRTASPHGFEVVGFVDDDPSTWRARIHGRRVFGGADRLPRLVRELAISEVLVALPDITGARMAELVDRCGPGVRLKRVPHFGEMVKTGPRPAAPRIDRVRPEDLLDRAPAAFDHDAMRRFLRGKAVLVTGATGSIGSEIARQVARAGVARLALFDVDENNGYFLRAELREDHPDLDSRLYIGSVRDPGRLAAVFGEQRPDIVFHAAAHKHVPLMEESPGEALKNNVVGTYNTAEAARAAGASRFVMVSSDKAVRPTNVMGASKRLAELVIHDRNRLGPTRFMAVRFGNVLGSSGSLLPIIERQLARGGPVTITDPDVTRYFMTIPEAVGLVLAAAAREAGEVCVLDMGQPVLVDRLVRSLVTLAGYRPGVDIELRYTGLRAGEKLHEELFLESETLTASDHPRIRVRAASESPMDVAAMLAELSRVADADGGAIRAFLKRYVPEYAPEDGAPTPEGVRATPRAPVRKVTITAR